jgi:hypothetical protein
VRPVEWWLERITAAGFKIEGKTVSNSRDGKPMWLYVVATTR